MTAGQMPGGAPRSGNSWVVMVAPMVTTRAEDVASAKRIVDDGEENSKILMFFSRI
jgi:hypothetical protein